jgi:hypothetical protein
MNRASAYTFSYKGKDVNNQTGSTLIAEAIFDYDGGTQLLITLRNLSPDGVLAPSDVLTALFFNSDPNDTMTPLYAKAEATAKLLNAPAAFNLGKEWDFERKIGGPKGSNAGIGAAGFGVFGQGNFDLPGNNVQGSEYGIVSGVNAGANKPTQSAILLQGGMVFAFEVDKNFSQKSLGGVYFQFGSAFSDPLVAGVPGATTAVPEPGTVALFGSMGTTLLLPILRRKLLRKGQK